MDIGKDIKAVASFPLVLEIPFPLPESFAVLFSQKGYVPL